MWGITFVRNVTFRDSDFKKIVQARQRQSKFNFNSFCRSFSYFISLSVADCGSPTTFYLHHLYSCTALPHLLEVTLAPLSGPGLYSWHFSAQ